MFSFRQCLVLGNLFLLSLHISHNNSATDASQYAELDWLCASQLDQQKCPLIVWSVLCSVSAERPSVALCSATGQWATGGGEATHHARAPSTYFFFQAWWLYNTSMT